MIFRHSARSKAYNIIQLIPWYSKTVKPVFSQWIILSLYLLISDSVAEKAPHISTSSKRYYLLCLMEYLGSRPPLNTLRSPNRSNEMLFKDVAFKSVFINPPSFLTLSGVNVSDLMSTISGIYSFNILISSSAISNCFAYV